MGKKSSKKENTFEREMVDRFYKEIPLYEHVDRLHVRTTDSDGNTYTFPDAPSDRPRDLYKDISSEEASQVIAEYVSEYLKKEKAMNRVATVKRIKDSRERLRLMLEIDNVYPSVKEANAIFEKLDNDLDYYLENESAALYLRDEFRDVAARFWSFLQEFIDFKSELAREYEYRRVQR